MYLSKWLISVFLWKLKINNYFYLMVTKIKKLFSNTILCLRYPFLYPRNRFNGRHYTNRWINKKIEEVNRRAKLTLSISFMTQEELDKKINDKNDKYVKIGDSVWFNSNELHLNYNSRDEKFFIQAQKYNNGSHIPSKVNVYSFLVDDYIKKSGLTHDDIVNILFYDRHYTTIMKVNTSIISLLFILKNKDDNKKCYTFETVNLNFDKNLKLKIGILKMLEIFIGVFHILPSYTELDSMDNGWRISFGEKICKDIRNSLLLTYLKNERPNSIVNRIKCYYKGVRHLLSYRILQIKEKFGQLRWYAYGDTKDTLAIIDRYEAISEKTCVVCGKNATYRSTGWVCPYCNEHKPDSSIKIGEENENIGSISN